MINDFNNNGNSSTLINLSPQQKQFVDETNDIFANLGHPLNDYIGRVNMNKPLPALAKLGAYFFNIAGERDLAWQNYNRKIDIMLQNTALRRRIADALQVGVNPVFALNATGAGGDNIASQPVTNKKSALDVLLKLLIGLTFLVK